MPDRLKQRNGARYDRQQQEVEPISQLAVGPDPILLHLGKAGFLDADAA